VCILENQVADHGRGEEAGKGEDIWEIVDVFAEGASGDGVCWWLGSKEVSEEVGGNCLGSLLCG